MNDLSRTCSEQAAEAAMALQEVKDRAQAVMQQAADAAERAAAQLLQEEASEAQAAQRCRDKRLKAAGKKARQKQRKQACQGNPGTGAGCWLNILVPCLKICCYRQDLLCIGS